MYRLTPLPPTHSLPVPEGPARVHVEAVLLLADGGEPLPPTSSSFIWSSTDFFISCFQLNSLALVILNKSSLLSLTHTHTANILYIYTHTQHRLSFCFGCVFGCASSEPGWPSPLKIFWYVMYVNNELEAYVLGFRLICSTIGANLDSRAENANFKGVFLVCTCCLFPPLRAQFLCRDDEF